MQAVHDRMPVIVPASRWDEWLDPANHDIGSLVDLFTERNEGILTMHPVSTEVNNVRNNDGSLIDPVERPRRPRVPDSRLANRMGAFGPVGDGEGQPSLAEVGADRGGGGFEVGGIDVGGGVGEAELRHRRGRDHVDVRVGHLVAGDDHPDPLAAERRPLGARRSSRVTSNRWAVRSGGRVDPVVDLLDRHDQGVTGGQRVDRHEHDAAVVAPDERAGDLAVDDPGEDRSPWRRPYASVTPGPRRAVTATADRRRPIARRSRSTGSGPIPNLFTLLRLLCLPMFLYLLFGRDNQAAAAWMLGALGATDWVDGYLARRLGQVSEFGKVFDPTVDRLLFIVAIVAIIDRRRRCRSGSASPCWPARCSSALTMAIATLVFKMRPHRRHLARQAGHVPPDVRRPRIPDGQQRLSRRRRVPGRRRGSSAFPAWC